MLLNYVCAYIRCWLHDDALFERLSVSLRLIHCSCVVVTMVAPRFSLRRPKRRDLSAASTYQRRACSASARLLPEPYLEHSIRRHGLVHQSAEVASTLPTWQQFHRFCDIGSAWLHKAPIILSREQFSTVNRWRRCLGATGDPLERRDGVDKLNIVGCYQF